MTKLQFYRDPNLDFYEIKNGVEGIPAEKPHCHAGAAVGMIERGKSMVRCQQQEFLVEADHIVVFPAEVMHKCSPQDIEQWKFKMLYVENSWLESVFGEELRIKVAVKRLSPMGMKSIHEAFVFLETDSDPLEKETALILLLSQVFAMTDIAVYEKEPVENEAAETLKAYLEDHYWENISLEQMAQVVNLTKYHLIRIFQRSYDMPPHAYMTQLRLSQAKEMLKDGMDISTVAISLGFYDQSHFSHVFKEYVGVTPLAYQKAD